MTEALDFLDDLTRSRDRSHVDATLVSSFIDLMRVERVALWRLQGEAEPDRVWECAALQRAGDLAALAGPSVFDTEPTVMADRLLDHLLCVEQGRVVTTVASETGLTVTLLPVGGVHQIDAVIELRSNGVLDQEHLRLAVGVLKIYRNFQSLLDYSERDTLTGLFNRKGFDDTLMQAAVADARLQFSPSGESGDDRRTVVERRYWLGVVDIDHFKLVNDRFGHLIGDEVLVLVARLMRTTFRYLDRLYRFGGEEFVILLVAPDDAGAASAFERLRANMESFVFPQAGRITISTGYTSVRAGDTPQAAFERADRAVYYAKEHGRNRVCCHEMLLAQGLVVADTSDGDVELF